MSLFMSHSVTGKIKHTLNVLHRVCIGMCCMHSINSNTRPQTPKMSLFVFNIAVYLKSMSDLTVRITHAHILSHFHNDNNANNNNNKKWSWWQQQLLGAKLCDRPSTCIISLNSHLTCESGTIFIPFC